MSTAEERTADYRSALPRRAEPDIVVDLRQPPPVRMFDTGTSGLLAAPTWKLATKRLIDVVGATLALVLLSPVFLVVGATVALTSPGPVFFGQERVGRDGKTFTFYKFRSMCDGADDQKAELIARNEATGPVFKIHDDPRLTPIGRTLRRFSLDELPQLWHVLRGQMSLVGPRPPVPEEVVQYSEWEWQRLLVQPGITCIWQVSGRADLDFDTWVRMDVEYIENWSLWLDLKLLVKTIPAVLSGRGAY